MKVFTDVRYGGRTLILPAVGQVTLDDKGGLDLADDKANELIEATKGGDLAFAKAVVSRVETAKKTQEEKVKEKVAQTPKKTKKQIEDEEAAADNEAMKEAIEEADLEGLQQLIALVPDVTVEQTDGLDQAGLKALLLSKLK